MTDDDRMLGLFRKLAQELKADPPADLPPGELLEAEADPKRRMGPYVLLDELGAGGAGRVLRAWHPRLRRFAAVKLLLIDRAKARDRFLREARIAAQLSHPCIVTVYDVGEHEGTPYLAMELVDGPTLAQVRMTPRESLEFMRIIAEAVQFAHERGVIHRDLKPANILLGSDGRPRITDFGLARLQEAGSTITAPGAPVGTPAFMSPEAATGGTPTARTDVYGLGATLYALLTGASPFDGTSVAEVIRQIGLKDPLPVASRGVRLHRDIATIVEKAMAREPADRYASARAFADDIGRYLEGRPILARPQPVVRRIVSALRRHRLVSALAGALVLLSAGTVVLGLRGREQDAEAGRREDRNRRISAILDASAAMLQKAEEAQYVDGATVKTVIALADETAKSIQKALDLDSGHAGANSMMARAKEMARHFDDAIRHYGKALETEPRLYSARFGRGMLNLRRHRDSLRFHKTLGNPGEVRRQALEDMEIAARSGGGGWESEYARASVDYAEGRDEAALRRLDGLRVLGPAAVDLHVLAASTLKAMGRFREGVERCEKALAIRSGDAHTLAVRAECLYDLGEFSQASDDFARALLFDPTQPTRWNMMAICAHYGKRDPKVVDTSFEAALKLDPKFVEAYSNRALVWCDRGDLDRAVADLTAAIAIDPDRIELYGNRCGMHQRQRNYDEAMRDAGTMVMRFPKAPQAWATRARVLSLKKQFTAAQSDCDEALKLDPDFGDALIVKMNLLSEEKRWHEAIAVAERALVTDKSGQALLGRATARLFLGDRAGAREDFQGALQGTNLMVRQSARKMLDALGD